MQPSHGDVSPEGKRGENSHTTYDSPELKKEKGEFTVSSPPSHAEDSLGKSSSPTLSGEEEEDEVQISENDDGQRDSSTQNQLVLYDPEANGVVQDEQVSDHVNDVPPPLATHLPAPPPRVLPSVGAFTVQCAKCFKWRLIPTKEKYEEIRETILQQPFNCARAREWRPDICCDDPPDISQDGSRIWAIDKPNIAQPPPGWERILRIRGEGSSKFADVYYAAPSGKRLRSMVEVRKYLLEHPEYDGVSMSQFSFQTPRPLQEDYVRKRPRNNFSATKALEPAAVNPLSWVRPVEEAEQNLLGQAATSDPDVYDDISTPIVSPPKKKKTKSSSKKKATKSASKDMYNSEMTFGIETEKFQHDIPHEP